MFKRGREFHYNGKRGKHYVSQRFWKVKWPANREHFWTNWRVSTNKTIETMYAESKLCSDGKFSETWDRFPIFHDLLLGNMKKSKKYLLSQTNLIQSSLP